MEEIIELIKDGKLLDAYHMADKMGLSQEDKYKLFVSEEGRKYNENKSNTRCVSLKTWNDIKNFSFEDCRR